MDDLDSNHHATAEGRQLENDPRVVARLDWPAIALHRCFRKTNARRRSLRFCLWPKIAGSSCGENEMITKSWQGHIAISPSRKNKHLNWEGRVPPRPKLD